MIAWTVYQCRPKSERMIEVDQLTVVNRVDCRDFAAKGLHAECGHGIADIALFDSVHVRQPSIRFFHSKSYPEVTFSSNQQGVGVDLNERPTWLATARTRVDGMSVMSIFIMAEGVIRY